MTRSGAKSAAKRLESKSEETRKRILEAALDVFRERGFARATMREVATRAGMAVGAAYYYFDSKEAIVLAFYERSTRELVPAIEARLSQCRTLEDRLRAVIAEKFEYFGPHRLLLGALAVHTDPMDPLSPFSQQSENIRSADIALFERAVRESHLRLPPRIAPYLPNLLWLYQMGLVLFWVYDNSTEQRRTAAIFDKSLQLVLLLLRFAGLPLLAPLQRMVAELLDAAYRPAAETRPE
jgi:AcrR family transcriptional regulator